MQVLTPTGYQDPVALRDGAALCAFRRSGRRIVNRVDNIDFVDYREWRRWWQHHDSMPPFNWVRINGAAVLFCEQSIWRNGGNVCHARDLVIGDELYDDEDDAVRVESIEIFEDRERVWYRFDVSGDHSYIVDGLTVHNASRFWVGGTGTWDAATTTNWAATSGGAGGQSVPSSADSVTLDGSSGGGTVTLNFGGTVTITTLTMGAFTGTFDNSVNNNNFTITANGNTFNGSGTGTRTYKLGTATYTLSGSGATFTIATATNLTYSGNTGCTIAFTGSSGKTFSSANALAHGTVSSTGGSARMLTFTGGGTAYTIQTLVLASAAYNYIIISSGLTLTLAAACAIQGSSSQMIMFGTGGANASAALVLASGSTFQWCGFFDLNFSGTAPTITDSFDFGANSGATISPPTSGGGGASFSASIS